MLCCADSAALLFICVRAFICVNPRATRRSKYICILFNSILFFSNLKCSSYMYLYIHICYMVDSMYNGHISFGNVFQLILFQIQMISKRRFSTRVRAQRDADSMDDNIETKKRSRGSNWSQEDTELLVTLILEHSKKGILCKITDATTNAMKKADWSKIYDYFIASKMVRICVLYLLCEIIHFCS